MRTGLLRHIGFQLPVIRTMAETGLHSLRGGSSQGEAPSTPGPWREARVVAPPKDLVSDFAQWTGCEAGTWTRDLPPHLFPQWTFGPISEAMRTLPWPMARVMNAGCRLEVRGELPRGEKLVTRCRVERIDRNERRAKVTMRTETGTVADPARVIGELDVYIPLGKGGPGGGKGERRRVSTDALEVARVRCGAQAGLEFAALTGDFNPIHWIGPAARMAGFRRPILHGFGAFGLVFGALARSKAAGAARRVRFLEARFVRPVVLPADLGVYVRGDGFQVGSAPQAPVLLEGEFDIV